LLVGQYAQRHFLKERRKATLTQTVQAWREYQPDFFPLPHPSFRNEYWLQKNPWFQAEVVPALRQRMQALL
jgi:uracil-DNA glycosylase